MSEERIEEVVISPPAAPEPPKRTISPEHLAKMREGRAKYLAEHGPIRRKAKPKRARNTPKVDPPVTMRKPRADTGVARGAPDTGPAPKLPPFRFPRAAVPGDPTAGIPRLVRLAEIGAVLDEMWPLLIERFPDARREMVRPNLVLATRGERSRLMHTGDGRGFALFETRQTPFEPEMVVSAVFVVGAPDRREELIAAGEAWARAVGAVRLDYETEVRADCRIISETALR